MFEIKYKNCLEHHDKIKNLYKYYINDKNHYIKIINGLEIFNIIITSNDTLLINNKEVYNKIKLILKPHEQIKINLLQLDKNSKLNKIKLYYEKKEINNIDENDIIINNNYKIKKNILHITHNFGGYIDIYINNMINIMNDFNHFVINIIDNDNVLYNNKMIKLNDIIKFKITDVIIHHLLYIKKDKIKMCNILDFINTFNINKFFIVHDYFLLYKNNPLPQKNEIISENDIDFIKCTNYFKSMNNVFFNSVTCYENYNKYISTDNYIILNNIPDIDIYNERIFTNDKISYNIAILENIYLNNNESNLITNNILEYFLQYFPKYKFYIFGEYNQISENVTIINSYNNKNIYNLIDKYDIDYFLFVSLFQETYSYNLSIALHTGLPIIYPQIYSYIERTMLYNNCYVYNENKIDSIYYILENIKKNNTNNKIVCFIHFTNLGNGFNIFNEQINRIKDSGLYDKLDYIFVTILGKHINILNDYKIKVIYFSENELEWEFPTIKLIKDFSDKLTENIKILYINTRGLFNKMCFCELRNYLEYFLIDKYEICLNLLNNYYCVGVNQQFNFKHKINHFFCNFWWSNSKYIKKLIILKKSKNRYNAVNYLIGDFNKVDYRYTFSLHHYNNDLSKFMIKPYEYNIEIIKSYILSKLDSTYIKKKKIYGVYFICCIDDYYNIVEEQINLLISNGLYNITDKILCFICKFEEKILHILKQYDKIQIISTNENLYEKYAINNYKKYISDDYYLYYFHSRTNKCLNDLRILCNHFTLTKWRISLELLNYYDCVGINLKQFPKLHYYGNYFWSKSEHLNKLVDLDDNNLFPEMYICSYIKTNKICIYQSQIINKHTEYEKYIYNEISDKELIYNITIIPEFNKIDKKCINNMSETELFQGSHIL